MSLHDLERQWRERATEAAADGGHATSKAFRQCATELRKALAGGGEAVAQLTTYEDTNSFSARMHDVVHDLPPGTYDLFVRPVDVDATMVERACVTNYADWLQFHQHERENFRKQMRAALTAALNPGGSRE